MNKPLATKAAAPKTAHAAKTVAVGKTNPAAKPAAKAASKTPAAAAPMSHKAAALPPAKAAGLPPAKAAALPPAKAAGKSSATRPEAPRPAAAPAAMVAPVPNRFTDRFAPARHITKTEPEPMDYFKPAAKVDPKLANAWKTKPGRELTEAELLAMPDGEYMNDKQVDYFRTLLIGQKDDLLSNAGETTEHLREDTTIVPDPADRATIEEEHALELRTRDRERKLLKKIAQSLSRLESGEYGFCDETGEPIGLARLLARPTATLSLEAQQRREMKQKMFGD